MVCRVVKVDGGMNAIVCTSAKRKKCSSCGRPADLLCDWKVKTKRSGTCDKPICDRCTHSPAPDKDLCPDHAAEWKSRRPSNSERTD